jgi:hypothetical protein
LELVNSLAFSTSGHYASRLSELPAFIRRQHDALEGGTSSFTLDRSILQQVNAAIKDPSFRDMLTLRRAAKNSVFSKQLNLHEVGPDGYRGRDVERRAFDAIKSVDDGDLYVIVVYEDGVRRQVGVPKDRWYAGYDLNILVERKLLNRSKLQQVYEELCESLIEAYLASAEPA